MRKSTWSQFTERPVSAFEMKAPAEEVGALLRRYRADLDAAARASAEGRAEGVAALAEQALLAAELAKRLERAGPSPDDDLGDLHALKDRMLRHVAAAGLEIVHLEGARAGQLVGLADVVSWQYDQRFAHAIVVEEIEPAVCHMGTPVRLGRVVMGAPPDGGPAPGADGLSPVPRLEPPPAADGALSGPPAATTIVCPIADCRTANALEADVCSGCLTDLAAYRRLTLLPRRLFNRGLDAARAGDLRLARDCFAAVMLWDPGDDDARDAYALTCQASGEVTAALDGD